MWYKNRQFLWHCIRGKIRFCTRASGTRKGLRTQNIKERTQKNSI